MHVVLPHIQNDYESSHDFMLRYTHVFMRYTIKEKNEKAAIMIFYHIENDRHNLLETLYAALLEMYLYMNATPQVYDLHALLEYEYHQFVTWSKNEVNSSILQEVEKNTIIN